MADIPEEPVAALEDIAYLARSENRLHVLETLTAMITPPGQPTPGYSRRQLADMTGTSRTTLGRVLTEFQDRGWARRNTDGEYVATPIGEHVAAEFTPLVRSMEALRGLGETAAIIPRSALSGPTVEAPAVSIREFSDGTVREPNSYDPTFFGRYFADLVDGAQSVLSMVYVATPQTMLTAFEDELHEGDVHIRATFSSSVTDHILANPEVGPRREHAAHERVEIYRYRDHIPCNLFVIDETVLLENSQVEGVQDGTVIETDNAAVREWAVAVIEHYIEHSELILPEDFS